MEWDYSGRKGRDGQKKKIGKANERKRKVKGRKDQEVNGQGGNGCPGPTRGTLHIQKIWKYPQAMNEHSAFIYVSYIYHFVKWLTLGGIARRSPLGSVNSLLSSRTEFKFSTHSGSTSPSNTIHWRFPISPRTLSMILNNKQTTANTTDGMNRSTKPTTNAQRLSSFLIHSRSKNVI